MQKKVASYLQQKEAPCLATKKRFFQLDHMLHMPQMKAFHGSRCMFFLVPSPASPHPLLQTRTEIQAHWSSQSHRSFHLNSRVIVHHPPIIPLFLQIKLSFYSDLAGTWLQQSRHRLSGSKYRQGLWSGCGPRADRAWVPSFGRDSSAFQNMR